MAIAHDTSAYLGKVAAGSSQTVAFDNSAGTFLTVGVKSASDTTTVDSVTYNAVSMTEGVIKSDPTAGARAGLWYLDSPATGSNNVVITMSGTSQIISGAVSFTGTSGSIGATASATGTSDTPSVSVTTTEDDSWVIDCVGGDGDTFTGTGTGQTVRWDSTDSRYSRGSTEVDTTPSSVTMSHTMSAGTANWTTVCMEILVESAAGPANLKTWNTVAAASVKTGDTVAIASIKTIDTVT